MRVPPAEEGRRRRTLGFRVWLIAAVVLIIIILASLRGLAGFYTNYLWFHEVGFSPTWRGLIAAKLVPSIVFTLFFFVLMLVNLIIADRLAPRTRAMGPEDEIVERYRSYVAPYAGRIRVVISAFFALIVGSGVSSQWSEWILFRNHVSFHMKDPQFHKDIGFYVFQLPFLRFVSQWLFVTFVLVLLVTAVFHYVNGGIRLQTPFQRVTAQVKMHLSVILALMAFIKTAQYYLARYQLVFSARGAVDGATYTDVKAQLPALNFLMVISVAAAVLFIVNIRRRGWVLPVIAVGLWGFISIVVGTAYPAYIQRFEVKPNEFTKEQTYISRNIAATRYAFGIDHIVTQKYDYQENLTPKVVQASAQTLDNTRLWDPDQLRPNFQQNQEFRPYFTFSDLDLDRYPIGDQELETEISVRELNSSQVPNSTWLNQHLVYTHGYGAAAVAGNAVGSDGTSPDYLLSDIPPTGESDELRIDQPSVYYGEGLHGFSIVDSKQRENQPTASQDDSTVRYDGSGGVVVSSFLRKAALALNFGSWDLFISHQVDSHSRVMFLRDVSARVQKAAPFLKLDADPYPVVINGRVEWVVDGYTTTNRFPYSQSLHPDGVSGKSGLDSTFNYVRNSVKATVDAYNGTITFYVIDSKDPIIRAYEKAFPDMFTSGSKVPQALRDHFRYPEDMFRAQTEQYQRYHLTSASDFYRAGNLWSVAPAPNGTDDGSTTPVTAASSGNNGGRSTQLATTGPRIDPLYLMMQLPGKLGEEQKQEFVLERSYVPAANANVLTAFIMARSDGKHYGQLVLYDTPDNKDIPSPSKAATNIDSNPDISKQLTLLDQRGSSVVRGDVQLIPVGDSILYVRPVYVSTTEGATFPRFRYVAVAYGEKAVLATSMPDALNQLFGKNTAQNPGTGNENPPPPAATGTVAELLAQAQTKFSAATTALKAGHLDTYAKDIQAAETLVDQAVVALDAESSTATTTPGSTSPTTSAGGTTSSTTTTTTLPPA
ncbi:MAG TPA: UPF0182 family protein [Acidimicrobiia bacterium]|jgi:hypothetical protein|nr:UPF0182 family protein [Acidimicrobiia bacterium]